MWFEKTGNLHDYFSEIESEGKIPEEEIVDEPYYVLTENMWENLYDGEYVPGLDTDGKKGSVYRDAINGRGAIVVNHDLFDNEDELRATAVHGETHIAIGDSSDIFNQEGIAYARENYFREKSEMGHAEIVYRPLTRIVNQWTESYRDAAEELGDERALELAVETIDQYDLSLFEKMTTPLRNPYAETFEEKVRRV